MININVLIITCFSTYEPRAKYVKKFYEAQGKRVMVLSTDYLHREKRFRRNNECQNDFYYMATIPYKWNLSLTRLISHYVFAIKTFKVMKKVKPEEVYVLIPGNSLCKFAAKYKQQHKCKLIIDIIDLWPESLPFNCIKHFFPSVLWKKLRDDHLKFADSLITECDLYKNFLIKNFNNKIINTVYWPQEDYINNVNRNLKSNIINFLYIGSINNIIDIDFIIYFLTSIQKTIQVKIHIIGDGEKCQLFLKQLDSNNIRYKYYGIVYDDHKICKVASCCNWALNFMKPSVNIGLTMKSVSYMALGVPIINNLDGDIKRIIEKNEIGFNVTKKFSDIYDIIVCSIEQNYRMGQNARLIYETFFSPQSFNKQLKAALTPLER